MNFNKIVKLTPTYGFLIVLCMMCMVGLFSSDIYLPSMPVIATFFNVNIVDVQQTLSIYLFGLSICQLLYGPISDRFGRKKTLITGIIIFIIASIMCSFAQSLPQLILARFLQSLGACAGMVMSKAIVGDLFRREEAAKIFMSIFPIVGASSAISPLLGGYLSDWLGWRYCFGFTVIFGILLLVSIMLFISETNEVTHRDIKTFNNTLKEIAIILKNPLFIGNTLVVCSVYSAYFGYLTESPFIFMAHGFAPHQIGVFYITLSLFYIMGNLIGRRLLSFITIEETMRIGIFLFLTGSFSMVGVLLMGIKNPWGIIIPMSILTSGNGFLLPLGIASTVTLFPNMVGTASSLVGSLQLIIASLTVSFINHLTHNSELLLAYTIACITILGSIAFHFFIYRRSLLYLKRQSLQ